MNFITTAALVLILNATALGIFVAALTFGFIVALGSGCAFIARIT